MKIRLGGDDLFECVPLRANLAPSSEGLTDPGSAVVVHQLDVVPVGIEDECAVVAPVVLRALCGRSVALVSGRNRCAVEVVDGRVVGRGKRDV
jgi:hypothetical protein